MPGKEEQNTVTGSDLSCQLILDRRHDRLPRGLTLKERDDLESLRAEVFSDSAGILHGVAQLRTPSMRIGVDSDHNCIALRERRRIADRAASVEHDEYDRHS